MIRRHTALVASASILLLMGAAQLIRPTWKDPPHQALLQGANVPPRLRTVIERACQDCHSNNTRWPWYARTIPAAWIIREDVDRGRRFMNLSEWPRYNRGWRLAYLAAMRSATRNREMPPRLYSALHPDARLTPEERSLIADWAGAEYARVRATSVQQGSLK